MAAGVVQPGLWGVSFSYALFRGNLQILRIAPLELFVWLLGLQCNQCGFRLPTEIQNFRIVGVHRHVFTRLVSEIVRVLGIASERWSRKSQQQQADRCSKDQDNCRSMIHRRPAIFRANVSHMR